MEASGIGKLDLSARRPTTLQQKKLCMEEAENLPFLSGTKRVKVALPLIRFE
jgi:hypothetical protein